MSVEQCDFTENLACANGVEHDIPPVSRSHTDLHGAGQDAHEPGPGITFCKNDGPSRYRSSLHVCTETLDNLRSKLAKQWIVSEKRQLVRSPSGQPTVLWN